MGNKWDVKRLISAQISKPKSKIDFVEFVAGVKSGISQGECILINLSEATSQHIDTLQAHLKNMLSVDEMSKVSFVNYSS